MNPLKSTKRPVVNYFGPGYSAPSQTSSDGKIKVFTPKGQTSRVKFKEPKAPKIITPKAPKMVGPKSASSGPWIVNHERISKSTLRALGAR
jgi:hypothetical protein